MKTSSTFCTAELKKEQFLHEREEEKIKYIAIEYVNERKRYWEYR